MTESCVTRPVPDTETALVSSFRALSSPKQAALIAFALELVPKHSRRQLEVEDEITSIFLAVWHSLDETVRSVIAGWVFEFSPLETDHKASIPLPFSDFAEIVRLLNSVTLWREVDAARTTGDPVAIAKSALRAAGLDPMIVGPTNA